MDESNYQENNILRLLDQTFFPSMYLNDFIESDAMSSAKKFDLLCRARQFFLIRISLIILNAYRSICNIIGTSKIFSA